MNLPNVSIINFSALLDEQTVQETEAPSAEWLGLIRGPVGEAIHEIYPEFARKMLGED